MSGKMGLGKGLEALLPSEDELNGYGKTYFLCPIEVVDPNPYQPRKTIHSRHLEELAASIRENGILQPLVIRRKGDRYELIAGERRWRAAQLAGLKEVPVVVKDVSSSDSLALALIENVQRQDLNPLEEAEAYQRLVVELNLTQEDVAQRVGKERSTVANYLRLINLPEFAKADLVNEVLTMGHARVLLALDDEKLQKAVRDEIIANGLSVRQSEALVKKLRQRSPDRTTKQPQSSAGGQLPDSYCTALKNELIRILGTKVEIIQRGARGKLEIEYYSADDLERLLGLIVRE